MRGIQYLNRTSRSRGTLLAALLGAHCMLAVGAAQQPRQTVTLNDPRVVEVYLGE